MSDADKIFTSISLAYARREAKARGVTVQKGLTTYQPITGYYEVWSKTDGIVWQGSAYNANDAKTKYIDRIINAANNS